MVEYYEPDTQEDVEAIRAYAQEAGARICYIQLNMKSFRSPFWNWERMFMFVYKGGAFNVRLPHLEKYATTVWDCIGQLNIKEAETKLTEAEQRAVRYLPNAWDTDTLATYCEPALYNPACAPLRPMRRFGWLWGCQQSDPETVAIHPAQHRPIAAVEWERLERSTLPAWLEQQRELFLSQWAESDNGEFEKIFDMRAYVVNEVAPNNNVESQPHAGAYRNAQKA